MQTFADPFFGRVAVTIVLGAIGVLMYFSLGIFLFLTRRNFGNININVAVFTRRDDKSATDVLRYKSNDTNVPLREILRNRYLFWYVVWRSFGASLEEPVLNFRSHTHAVLSPIRGRAARQSASMEFKRLAGLPFVETSYQLSVVYDRSEDPKDKRSRILRVILVPVEVFENFGEYLAKPPHNTWNWTLMKKIQEAYEKKTGSFIRVDITTA